MAYYLIYDPNNGNRMTSETEGPDPAERSATVGRLVLDVGTKPNWRLKMWDEATASLIPRPQKPPPPPAVARIENHPLYADAVRAFPSLDAAKQDACLKIIIEAV